MWPASVDSYEDGLDECARACIISEDECRYFTYSADVDMWGRNECRFHEEKGGCHPQPTSHRRRYRGSSAYLIPKEINTTLSASHIADALEAGRDYTFSHVGFCASGWLSGMVNHRSTLEACARWCRDVPVCGHFTFSANQEICSLYDVEDECPSYSSDHTEADFRSFKLVRPAEDDDHYSDYQLKHMGFCDLPGSDFLGQLSDRQFPYVFQCAEYCHDTEGCEHFSFSRRNFHCRLFGETCTRPSSPYGDWEPGGEAFHGEPTQYGLENNLQYGESNVQNNFTWHWEQNDWYPWALPNTTDYMYSSYRVGSGYRRDPGSAGGRWSSFGSFIACGDEPNITMESGIVAECRDFFPGWTCSDTDLTNYSDGNCTGSCGYCTNYLFDIDLGAANTHGYGCEIYNEMPLLCDIAEEYDDDDFTAGFHCAVCGGGSRNTCLPDDFVTTAFPGHGTENAYVKSLDPEADTITVEFPHHTGAVLHEIPRTDVNKGNGRACSQHSQTLYTMGWAA